MSFRKALSLVGLTTLVALVAVGYGSFESTATPSPAPTNTPIPTASPPVLSA